MPAFSASPSVIPRPASRVGFLPENPAFYDFLTAREYLRFVGEAFAMPAAAIRKESERVLELLDLTGAAGRPIRGYSKGMVQRLGLAQTLLHNPDLYILDEPMSGLDPIGRALVKEIILDLKRQGKTVFFSTHVTADAERVCDRIGVIIGGVFQEERVVGELLREGIDGYFCRVRGVSAETLQTLGGMARGDGVCEVFVPRDQLRCLCRRSAEKRRLFRSDRTAPSGHRGLFPGSGARQRRGFMRLKTWHCLTFLALAVLAVYYPSLHAGYNSVDDLKMISGIDQSGPLDLVHLFVRSGSYYYRPLTILTYILDRDAWGSIASFMHLENILLHLACAWLVFAITRRLLPLWGEEGQGPALFAGLFFALHPLATESVCWISGRTDPLMAVFLLLAVWLTVVALSSE